MRGERRKNAVIYIEDNYNSIKEKMIVRDKKEVSMFMEKQILSLWQMGSVWYIGVIQTGSNKIHHHGSESYIKKLWKKS